MRPSALAAAVLSAMAGPPALSQEIAGSEFEAGNWIGGAFHDDRGAFSYCYTTVSYLDGQTLWIGLYPNDTISILMSQPDVTFQPGQTFELWVMMETGLPAIGNGEAWDATYGGITYTGIQPTIDFLISGRYLRMLGMGIDDGFDIDGVGPALDLARDCLARRGGAEGGGATPGPAQGAPDQARPRTSGVGVDSGSGSSPGGALGTPVPKPLP